MYRNKDGIRIYQTEKELYERYEKHPLYNYPIRCSVCKSWIRFNAPHLKCDCGLFDVEFPIGIRMG